MTHETSLRRARLCTTGSTILFVLFCLLGGPAWDRLTSAAWAEDFKILSLLSGIFAWTLMCAAYDFRRKAL